MSRIRQSPVLIHETEKQYICTTVVLPFQALIETIESLTATCWDEGMRDNCLDLYYYGEMMGGGGGDREKQQSKH